MERNGDNQGDDPSGGRVESDRELLRQVVKGYEALGI